MNGKSLYMGPDGGLRTDLGEDEVRGVVASGHGTLWLHLVGEEAESRRILRDLFDFHPLAIDDCFNARVDTPKVDDYERYLFIIAQSVAYLSRGERIELEEVAVFLGKNYVVTFTAEPVEAVEQLFSVAHANPLLVARGPDFVTHQVLDRLVNVILPAVEEMDEHLDNLEQRILERPDRQLLPELLLLKRNTLRLRRSVLSQRDLVNRLSRGEFHALIRGEALMFYRDVYDSVVRIDEILEGLREIADSALSSYLSAVNNRMNEVMKAMSVVAVIFLPLTLIASIYGTNLDYSIAGLTFEEGFLLMLAAMLAIAAALVVYFRRRGWF